uniref:Uncharacterized protein n=1 Tax=Chrysolophus pictus TaxID=9089 RepID=A0A8C3LZU1_CHRPC
MGSLWGSMGLYGVFVGSLWGFMGPYTSLWVPIGLYGVSVGSLWVPMGSLWVFMGFCGVPMGPYGSLWVSMGLYGFLWVPMGLYGSLCVPMGLYGSLWVSVGLYGSLWVSMGRYGSLWVPMGHSGAPRAASQPISAPHFPFPQSRTLLKLPSTNQTPFQPFGGEGGGTGSEGGTSASFNQSPAGQLLQFEENYGAALDGYARAAALAPDWPEPRMRRARLLDYLGRICAALGGAGKARGRRRRALSPSLLGALGDAVTPMAALWDGDNVGRALLGRVLGCVLPEERVPIRSHSWGSASPPRWH